MMHLIILKKKTALGPLINTEIHCLSKVLSISAHQPYCSPTWTCPTKIALLFPLGIVFLNFNNFLPILELKEKYHLEEKNNI